MSEKPKEISPGEFSEALNIPFLNSYMVEVIWGSKWVDSEIFALEPIELMKLYSARISAVKSREIGWEPRRNLTDFYHSFETELNVIAQSGSKH